MRYLLDTNALLWFLTGDEKLGGRVRCHGCFGDPPQVNGSDLNSPLQLTAENRGFIIPTGRRKDICFLPYC